MGWGEGSDWDQRTVAERTMTTGMLVMTSGNMVLVMVRGSRSMGFAVVKPPSHPAHPPHVRDELVFFDVAAPVRVVLRDRALYRSN